MIVALIALSISGLAGYFFANLSALDTALQ